MLTSVDYMRQIHLMIVSDPASFLELSFLFTSNTSVLPRAKPQLGILYIHVHRQARGKLNNSSVPKFLSLSVEQGSAPFLTSPGSRSSVELSLESLTHKSGLAQP